MILVLSFYIAILAFLSLNPWTRPDSSLAVGPIGWDKIDHIAAYGLLALLMLLTYKNKKPRRLVSFLILLTCIWIGVFLEYCQLWFSSTRSFSYDDVLANLFGSASGAVSFWCYRLVASHVETKR